MISKSAFVDSDILLDLFLKREPFFRYSQDLLLLSQKKELLIYTSTLVVANIHYLLAKALKNKTIARQHVKLLTTLINVLPVDNGDIQAALNGTIADFEDAIQYNVAQKHNCGIIITRNIKDYKLSAIPVLTAEQYLQTL